MSIMSKKSNLISNKIMVYYLNLILIEAYEEECRNLDENFSIKLNNKMTEFH